MGQWLCWCGTRPDSRPDLEAARLYKPSYSRSRCAAGHSLFFRVWWSLFYTFGKSVARSISPWNLVSSNPHNLDLMCHSVTWWVLVQETWSSSSKLCWRPRSTTWGLRLQNQSKFYTKFEKEQGDTDTLCLQDFDLLLESARTMLQDPVAPGILHRAAVCSAGASAGLGGQVEPSTASNSSHPLQNLGPSHVYIKADTVNRTLTYPNHVEHLPIWEEICSL